jgi:hypothetical protein
MAATATPEQTVAAATAEREISEKFAVPGAKLWDAEFSLGRTIGGPDTDTTQYSAGRFPVYPDVWKSAGESARQTMAVLAEPGVVSVALGQAVPLVTAETPEQLDTVYAAVQKTPAFAGGGDYWADDGRVRIADVPDHLTDVAVHAILEAASAYPTAEFWLQTPRDQNHWPVLYVNHVAPGDDAVLAARFSAAELAAANVSGAALSYVITQNTGGTALTGTFGGE